MRTSRPRRGERRPCAERTRRLRRRAARVDVVDQRDTRGAAAAGANAPATLRRRSASASPRWCGPAASARAAARPAATSAGPARARAALPGGVRASTPGPVGRDERQHRGRGRATRADDDLRRVAGEPAQPALLPGRDEPPHAVVVLDRSTRGGERETAARALPAARDGPGGRRATTLAKRWTEQRQAVRGKARTAPPRPRRRRRSEPAVIDREVSRHTYLTSPARVGGRNVTRL